MTLDAFDPSRLVGREEEMARLEAVLSRRRPAIVVVAGRVGVGKSTLLQAVNRRAEQLGWRTAQRDDRGRLQITPTTSVDEFCTRVCDLLGVSDEEEPTGIVNDVQGAVTLAALGIDSARQERDPATPSRLHVLALQLHELAQADPVLLTVDAYEPDAAFDRMFAEAFLKEIRGGETPIVVLLTDTGTDAPLHLAVDEVILVGPPEPAAVREHFRELDARLSPRLRPEELEAYVELVRQDPASMSTLTSLLAVAASGDEP